jgi:nucleotide-binding universal stress UspA family protein
MKIQTILCPVDFSEFSARAYDYAHSLARHYHARLTVLHAVEPILSVYRGYLSQTLIDEVYSREVANAREQAHKLSQKHKGEEVETEIIAQWGLVQDLILSFAEKHEVDLIVMGTHGRRGLDRLTMGSTTERVLRKARCAVLTVREPATDFVNPASPEEPVRLRKLTCCIDFSENSPRALEHAFSLAFQYHAELTLLHVIEDTKQGADPDEQARQMLERLEEVVPVDARDRAAVVPVVRSGRPYQEIIEYAAHTHTDLIFMGVRGRNALDLALFGSTTYRVIQLGPCPVLVVKDVREAT